MRREGKEKVDSTFLQMSFLFSVLWGLCSTLAAESKKKFNLHFRNVHQTKYQESIICFFKTSNLEIQKAMLYFSMKGIALQCLSTHSLDVFLAYVKQAIRQYMHIAQNQQPQSITLSYVKKKISK